MPEVITKDDLCEIRAEGPPPARGPLEAAIAGWGSGAMLPVALAAALVLVRRRTRAG
jgi:uncharacterized protein (TIGR03382 family)